MELVIHGGVISDGCGRESLSAICEKPHYFYTVFLGNVVTSKTGLLKGIAWF
jgi:hypothetical protein